MLLSRLVKSAIVSVVLISLSSCGKGGVQIVKGIKVDTVLVGQEVNVRVVSEIDFGNIMFPSLQIPVYKPRTSQLIGSVSMVPVLGSKTQLVVEINASALTDLSVGPVLLPNGTLAPLIGTNAAIEIDLGNRAKLYVAAAQNAYALGVAIPISGLDSLGQSMGGINFFPMFSIDRAIGAAGLFTSSQKGQNGFGFFVDLTQYVQGLNWGAPIVATQSATSMKSISMLAVDSASSVRTIELDYREQRPSSSKEKKLNNKIYDMHRRKTRLAR
jgi:hypothetical protein